MCSVNCNYLLYKKLQLPVRPSIFFQSGIYRPAATFERKGDVFNKLEFLFHYGYSVPGFVILRVLPGKKPTIWKVN